MGGIYPTLAPHPSGSIVVVCTYFSIVFFVGLVAATCYLWTGEFQGWEEPCGGRGEGGWEKFQG